MIYFLPSLLSKHECERLVKIFDKEKEFTASVDNENTGTKNSYGFRPSERFNKYLQIFKPKVLEFCENFNWIEDVNTFIRQYNNDSILKKHIDRKDISVTMSVCLESTIDKEWPIHAIIDGIEYSYHTNVGDAVLLFDADKNTHWRDKLVCENNERVVQFFLHWMPTNIEMKKQKTIL